MRVIILALFCLALSCASGCINLDENKSRVHIPSDFTIDIPKGV